MIKQEYELTTPQKNIWNLHQYYAGTAIANLCGVVIFEHSLNDVDILRKAIRVVIHEQAALRLQLTKDDIVKQYIADDDNPKISVKTFSDKKEIDAYAERYAREPITAYEAPLYRFTVLRIKNGKTGVLAVLSHLITDAWSFSLLVGEIKSVYYRLTGNAEVDTPIAADYTSFIHSDRTYLSSERYIKDQEYWEKQYSYRPEVSSIRPESESNDNIKVKRVQTCLERSLNTKIDAFCKNDFFTPAVLFETSMLLYLAHINPNNKTVTIGIPVLNRRKRTEKKTIGMFISTMPLTIEISGQMKVKEILKAVSYSHREIFRHQRYPYTDLLRYLREKQNFEGNLYSVNKLTNKILKNSDFEWKQIDDEYIRGYWEYFREIGYWKM